MSRICVVGNSHASMIFAAAKNQFDDLALTYFAKPKLMASDFEMAGSVLRPSSKAMVDWLDKLGSPSQVDLATFDAVIITALFTSIYPAVRIAQSHAITGWPSQRLSLAAKRAQRGGKPGMPLMTRDTYVSILKARNQQSLGYSIAQQLRRVSDTPIYIIAQPFPSVQIRNMRKEYPVMNDIVARGDGEAMAMDLQESQKKSFSEIRELTYVPQDPDTVVDGCLSGMDFTRDARRLDIEKSQPKADVMHANAALGSRFLQNISKDIASKAPK